MFLREVSVPGCSYVKLVKLKLELSLISRPSVPFVIQLTISSGANNRKLQYCGHYDPPNKL